MPLLSAALLCALPQADPQLFVDLDAADGPPISSIVSSGGRYLGQGFGEALIGASDFGVSQGVWRSDGTPAGTVRLTPADLGVPVDALELPGGLVLFTSEISGDGRELFVTDGSPESAVPLAPLGPDGLLPSKVVSDLVLWDDRAWFVYRPATGSAALWSSDGTDAGTQLEWTLGAAFGDLDGAMVVAQDRLFLNSPPGSASVLVFTTPGAGPAGNLGIEPLNDLAVPSSGAILFQGDLVFAGRQGTSGYELWRTDGTPSGTGLIADIYPGALSSLPQMLAADDNFLWFIASQPGTGGELWRSDGTTAGTQLVDDLNPGFQGSSITAGGVLDNGDLVFSRNELGGSRVWVSDGTAAGTQPLTNPFDIFSGIQDLAARAGTALFAVSGPDRGLWTTDGTVAGTQRIADAWAELLPGSPTIQAEAGKFWFTSNEEVSTGAELWSSDGTAAGTDVVANLAADLVSSDSRPRGFTRLGDRFVFTAESESRGRELYVSDGTVLGTGLLADIWLGPNSSEPRFWGVLGDRLLFSAETASGREPWATDGTTSGTFQLADLRPGELGSDPGPAVLMDGYALFPASPSDPPAGTGISSTLYRTDGTSAGTVAVPASFSALATDFSRFAARLGDRLLFDAGDAFIAGLELWVTDGTSAGTVELADIAPGPFSSTPVNFERLGDSVFFAAETPGGGSELFVTDGTTAGTQLFFELVPGAEGGRPYELLRVQDQLFFLAYPESGGVDLWRTDGTVVGTLPLTNLALSGFVVVPFQYLTAVGEDLVCVLFDAGEYSILTSDGTVAGTVLSLAPPGTTSFESPFPSLLRLGASETLVFDASTLEVGQEIWTLETPGGAPQVFAEVQVGMANSRVANLFEFRGDLYFSAEDPAAGNELFRLNLGDAGLGGATRLGLGCSGLAGQPEIDWSGSANLGAQLELRLGQAAPVSIALAFYSNPLVLGLLPAGCTIYVGAPKLLATTMTDNAGRVSLTADLPLNPALVGQDVVLQWVTGETGGPFTGSFGLSDALEVVFGP